MKQITKNIGLLCGVLLMSLLVEAQLPVLSLDTILARIDRNNISLQGYALKAEGYKYSAEASTAWMAPMVGIGTFMTPYPGQKIMEDRDKGNIMVQIEQDIPNRSKLNARKRFIASKADAELADRDISLNELRSQAKRIYYNWLIALKKIEVLEENERTMATMKKIEEVRYPYNQSQLGNIYSVDAKIEENRNRIRMQEGTIGKAMAWLNNLMNAAPNNQFAIDTINEPHFAPAGSYDTATLALMRKDVRKMSSNINTMKLNIESMRKEKKPDFRIRFDHMNPLGGGMMPKAFSVMGMVSIPIVPWASKMYRSEIKAMEYTISGMEKERSGMLQETQGMLYGMQFELQSMHERVLAMEEKVIPALKRSMDANFMNYQENKLALPVVIESWEALNMMQLNVLDEKLQYYEMIVDYEKQLFR